MVNFYYYKMNTSSINKLDIVDDELNNITDIDDMFSNDSDEKWINDITKTISTECKHCYAEDLIDYIEQSLVEAECIELHDVIILRVVE